MYHDQQRQRRLLEAELRHADFVALLPHVRKATPALDGYANWADVITFLTSRDPSLPAKDAVLTPLLAEYARTRDPKWYTILTLIFWPTLVGLHRRTRAWDVDAEELWQNLFATFMETLLAFDLAKRPDRLMPKVFYVTWNRLRATYESIWKQRRKTSNPQDPIEHPSVQWDLGLKEVEDRDEEEAVVRRLQRQRDVGVINQAELDLIVATRLRDESLKDYVQRQGLSYSATRSCRSRAERAIRQSAHVFNLAPAA